MTTSAPKVTTVDGTCTLRGCDLPIPHGHGTDAITRPADLADDRPKGRTLDDLLLAAFEAGASYGGWHGTCPASEPEDFQQWRRSLTA